jgi:hypothetical protein
MAGEGRAHARLPVAAVWDDAGPASNIAEVALGNFGGCAVAADGNVYCWGDGLGGELGWPGPSAPVITRPARTGALTSPAFGGGASPGNYSGLALGYPPGFACVTSAGAVRCWGYNFEASWGAAGGATPVPTLWGNGTPAVVLGAAGDRFSCAQSLTGDVFCAGSDGFGQAVTGTPQGTPAAPSLFAKPDSGAPSAFLSGLFAVGSRHACAVALSGTSPSVYCQGFQSSDFEWENELGEFFISATVASPNPPAGAASWPTPTIPSAIRLGTGFGCLTSPSSADASSASNVHCWGAHQGRGRLGQGTGAPSKSTLGTVVFDDGSPIAVRPEPTALALGYFHACAILAASGQVVCWGFNTSGQLGNGTLDIANAATLVRLPDGSGPMVGAVAIAAGGETTCAIVDDPARGLARRLFCWGSNENGQLADGTRMIFNTPVRVAFPPP